MISRYSYGSLTWLDVTNPSTAEVHKLVAEAHIPLLLANDLTTSVPRSEVTGDKNALKVTLDFPIVKRTDINHPHEIKFIVTKSHLITIRFEDIEAIHRFGKDFEVLSLTQNKKSKATGGHLFVTLLSRMYQSLDVKLDYIESKITDVEDGIFAQKEREMVIEIAHISKRLIDFRQTLNAHTAAILKLPAAYEVTFNTKERAALEQIRVQFEHILNRTAALNTTLIDLRETNNSLLTTKQNEVMKTFTILAFLTFPLTLFTSAFGMNTRATPIIGHRYDFWIIVSIMLGVSIIFFMYFRYRKWM